jgi:hypothetical protein
MRIVTAIVGLCVFVGAYLILVIDRHHERIGDHRRASRGTVMGFRIIGIAGLVLLAWSLPAHARPSPYPAATQFSGDRYEARQAQGAGAADAVNAVRSKRRARHLYPTRKRPLVRRHDMAQVPGKRVNGRPSAWCGWWLGQHLGMPLPASLACQQLEQRGLSTQAAPASAWWWSGRTMSGSSPGSTAISGSSRAATMATPCVSGRGRSQEQLRFAEFESAPRRIGVNT